MRKVNPEYVRAVIALANSGSYFRLISMSIRELGRGHCLMEAEIDGGKHLQAFGFVHGGVYSSLIDTAAFWAAICDLDEDMGITTVDLNVNYLAPIQEGKLITRGKLIKLGRTLGLGEATVTTAAGKLVAHGTSTLMLVPGLGFARGKELPPKFMKP
ncbi:MAG: PaaI family thioesterase [Syntrophobacterales bacterium]|jgi:uncharacterized protein (TIGR00369 family)|nr:PaaI family thioesterase [Syntrophobacterales bacterium]